MDFTQKKLTKNEWEAIEIPQDEKEIQILKLIKEGYNNVNIKKNTAMSILTFMKIHDKHDLYHYYFYDIYFKKKIDRLISKYSFPPIKKLKNKKIKLKKGG